MRKLITLTLTVLPVGLLAAVAFASWTFSSKLLDPDHSLGPFGIEVERVEVRERAGGGRELVSFERTDDSARAGIYGLDYPDGHAIAGGIVRNADGGVTRRVSDVRGELESGTKVAFDEQVWNAIR